jgi:hypothetical protein
MAKIKRKEEVVVEKRSEEKSYDDYSDFLKAKKEESQEKK